MKKYRIFRSFTSLDRDIKKHELVAVEYGNSIDEVTNKLMKAVTDDAEGLEKYQQGKWRAEAYVPSPVDNHRKVKRYTYEIIVVLYPSVGEKNDIIEYGIIEDPTIEP